MPHSHSKLQSYSSLTHKLKGSAIVRNWPSFQQVAKSDVSPRQLSNHSRWRHMGEGVLGMLWQWGMRVECLNCIRHRLNKPWWCLSRQSSWRPCRGWPRSCWGLSRGSWSLERCQRWRRWSCSSGWLDKRLWSDKKKKYYLNFSKKEDLNNLPKNGLKKLPRSQEQQASYLICNKKRNTS